MTTQEKAKNYQILVSIIDQPEDHLFNKRGKSRKISIKKLLNQLRLMGYTRHKTVEELEAYLLNNIFELNLEGKIAIPKNRRGEILKKKYQGIIDSYENSRKNFENANPYDIVIRSYMGNKEVLIYDGGRLSRYDINMLKKAYSVTTDLNYLDARPIYYKNWENLPEERQYMTYGTSEAKTSFMN